MIGTFPSRNLCNLDSRAGHTIAVVLTLLRPSLIGLFHELGSGTHQAFASIPIGEDAHTWSGYAKPIPGYARSLTKLPGALQDRGIIDSCHPDAPCCH
jgi:hypothetical protein